jgi:uncharacterized protein RhaS with RHS repeats
VSLDFYRFRFYDPARAMFLSSDPIGLLGGVNLFAYVANTPLVTRDPFGLCSEEQERTQNQLDQAYQRLAQRPQATILDQAVPEIADRARPMGEMDTYGQLALMSLLANYFLNSAVYTAYAEVGLELSATYPRTFEVTTDVVLSLAPTVPAGLIQHVSTVIQRWLETKK